jgi:serine/threonine protein kinase
MADLQFLSQEWPVISRRLDEALVLAPGERGTWLAGLVETDSVKDKLRELLAEAARVETADYLGALPRLTLGPAEMAQSGSADTAVAGAVIGPYRLIRELGVGGMGLVWLAERVDGGLKRQVALKLPRLSWSRGLAERMSRERDILASLDHPNIARLYDAGLDEQGRPYLALEYVEGEAIDVYCKRHSLSVRDRLMLVLQVARAVTHAHARLVVHRDLKPANILVTADGQVRLLDFGIAKLMEGELTQETQLTQQSGRALTLDYASPEQIRGEPLGTASDVYSLGVVAYELLTEAKPYRLKRESTAALEEAIASVDVRPASTAAASPSARSALKGDLDAILNKTLKKTVSERYPGVESLLQDMERHLANLPVLARPDALSYRFLKFARRNRLSIAAAAAVSVALVAGLSVALLQTREALMQADRAERVKEFMVSIFEDADTDSGAGSATTAGDLLKAARGRVTDELTARPEVAVELMTSLGYALIGQGMTDDAASLMHDAVDLSTRRLGSRHALTRAAQAVHGDALVVLGRNKEAIAVLLPAIQSSRRAGDLSTLNASLRSLSAAQMNEGQLDEAIEMARESVATLSAHRETGKPLGPRDAMYSHLAYATALNYGYRPGAVDAAQLALRSARELYGHKLAQPVLDIRMMLAVAQVTEGRQREEGLRQLDTLTPAVVELLGPHHPQVATTASFVGATKLIAGDIPGAIAAFRHSMAVEDALGGSESHFRRGRVRFLLAGAYASARQPAEALPLLDEAIRLLKMDAAPDNALALRAVSVRAGQLAEAGRLVEADDEFRTLESARWTGPYLAAHQARLAALRILQGRHEDAVRLAEQSASETVSKIPRADLQAGALALLGRAHLDSGNALEALKALQESRALYAKAQPGVSADHAEMLVALGRTQLQLGDIGPAVQSLSTANRFWQSFDPTNRHAGLAALYLAQALWAQGEKRAGEQALHQADALLLHSAFPSDRALLESVKRRLTT